MIFSFSVPNNQKNRELVEWYMRADKQERSREFREILMSYLKKSRHTMETNAEDHVSRSIERVELVRMEDVGRHSADDDLDSRLDLIGVGGEFDE
jgi:hypothetical protein